MLHHCAEERAKVTFPYVVWDAGFKQADIDAFTAECLRAPLEEGTVLSGEKSDIRRSNVRWILWSQENRWMWDRLDAAIEEINNWFYGFKLLGYDSMQYTEYTAEEQGHYGWHMDLCMGTRNLPANMIQPRKLSFSLLLNEPGVDFEGGEFQINNGTEKSAETAKCKKGCFIAFPSWMIHRVTPVTKGVRKSLVIWVVGPKFE